MSRDKQHAARGGRHGRYQPDLEPLPGESGNRRDQGRHDSHHAHRNSSDPGNRKRTGRFNGGTDIVESSESVTVDSNSIVRSWVAHIRPVRLPPTLRSCCCTVKYFALQSDVSRIRSPAFPKEVMRKRLTMHIQRKGLGVKPQRGACLGARRWCMTWLSAWRMTCRGAWRVTRFGVWRGTCLGALAMAASITTAQGATLNHEDMLWLDRVTYGPTTAVVDQYLKLGRRRFLAQQLHPTDLRVPPAINTQITALDVSHTDPAIILPVVAQEQQRINALPDEGAKQNERKALNDKGNHLAYEAARREILRALYSPAQLQEQLDWFWLNHLSV